MGLRLLLAVGGVSLSLAACLLPPFGPLGYVAVTGGPVTCVSQSSLQVGQACGVTCEPNSTNVGGTTLFACGQGDVLVSPTLVCEPSCMIPAFGPGIVGSSNPNAYPCSPGVLCRSCTCDLACDASRNFTAGSGTPTYVCTSGGVLRGGTLNCFPCILPTDFNISHLDQTNASGLACSPGSGLPNSTSCNLACNPNYILSGNNQYYCDANAVLHGPNMTCAPQPCTLPPITLPFVPGTCNVSSLAPGASCAVQCDSRHSPASGNANFTCESLVPAAPTLMCVPNNCTAVLPSGQNYAFDASLPNACSPGGTIVSGSSCGLTCDLGFEAVGGSESLTCNAGMINSTLMCQAASCAFFRVLPPGHVPINCVLGGSGGANATLLHGASCRVGCAAGYTGPQQSYSCSFGIITSPPPFCVPNSCTLPSFGAGFLGNPNGPHNTSCTSGGTLSSSASCDVMCDNANFTTSAGSLSYSCSLGVLTAMPTAQCLAAGSCAYPSLPCLQSQTCAGGSCSGSPLADGASCNLACVSTFTPNASLVGNLSCSNGSLTMADDFCFPTSCNVNLTALGIMGVGVTGCADGGTLVHNQTCNLGCNTSLQLVVPAQMGSAINCLYGKVSVYPVINNQFCRVPACILPTSLPPGLAFLPNGTGCTPGGLLENYPADGACNLRCDQGYSGSAQYQCTQAGLALVGSCTVQNCAYTVGALTGVVAGNTTQCGAAACGLSPGSYSLANGTCCDYQCDVGYHVAPGASLRLTCPTIPTNCGNFSVCTTTPAVSQVRCDADTCTLGTLGPNVVGVGASPCSGGLVLPGGGANSSCAVDCAPGFDASGSMSYSCSLGVLTSATLTCTPSNCTLPTLPYGQQGNANGGNALGCSAGLTIQSGKSCDVSCAEVTVPGTSSFSCVRGNLTSATLICLATGACLLPLSFLPGQFPSGFTPCVFGTGNSLADGQNCSVACAAGFNVSNPTSVLYSCTNGTLTPPNLTCTPKPCDIQYFDPMVPSSLPSQCSSASVLQSGQSCTLACSAGYIPQTIVYSCDRGSTTLNGSCIDAPCPLPTKFPDVFTTATISGCNQSGVLSSGSQCSVQCPAGYFTNPGSTTYSCFRGNLTVPNASCSPLPCTKTFGPNEVPDNSTGIPCNGTLTSGESCQTRCADGFVGESRYKFQCNLGNLTTHDGANGPTCTPMGCVIPPYSSANVVSASAFGCFPGDVLASGSSCSWGCATTGFYDLLGADVFTCFQGVLTTTAVGMSCIPFACTLLPLGNDVIGVAAGAIPACNSSLLLGNGASCGIGCASLTLSAGSSVFSCSAGKLTSPTAVCYNNQTQCVLNFNSPVIGESLGSVFACGPVLAAGLSCRVGCASGYVPNGGTRIYTCGSAGILSATPTLMCLGASCPVPDLSAQAVLIANPQCTAVPALPADPGCAYGYSARNGSSSVATGVINGRGGGEVLLSCALCAGICASFPTCSAYQCSPTTLQCSLYTQSGPQTLPSGDFVFCSKTGPSCSFGYHAVVGDVLGSGKIGAHGGNESVLQCSICADYCSSQSSCLSYECNQASRLCNLNTIAVPNGPAISNFALCVKDAIPAPVATGFLASGSSCQVQCNTSYVAAAYPQGQTTQYSCQGGQLTYPTLRCLPRPCTYPTQFPNNYGTPNTGQPNKCVLGGPINVGSSCFVGCAAYFYRSSGSGLVTCSLGPSLSTPSLMCAPFLCSVPSNPVGYQVSGCPNNSSSAQCSVTCAAGYSSTYYNGTSAGPVAALCPADGGIFEFSGCVPLPRCTKPTPVGYSVTCTGTSPYLASDCSASCAAGFGGTANLDCSPSGTLTLSGCSSCVCPKGTGRSGGCSSACVPCSSLTANNGSGINCTACPSGTCPNQNRTGCAACVGGPAPLDSDEGISDGGIAAAVLVPLIIIGLAVAGFFVWKKKGGNWKRKKPTRAEATNDTSSTEMTSTEKEMA